MAAGLKISNLDVEKYFNKKDQQFDMINQYVIKLEDKLYFVNYQYDSTSGQLSLKVVDWFYKPKNPTKYRTFDEYIIHLGLNTRGYCMLFTHFYSES